MALTIENDTAIHEAGHGIIVYLAHQLFEIEYVTSNRAISSQEDSSSLGALKSKLKKERDTLLLEDHDMIVLILLAGMAADDVNHCNSILNNALYDNKTFLQKIESRRYSGDKKLLLPHLFELVNYYDLDQRLYTISCQKILYKIFTIDWITEILVNLRNKIIDSENQTLSGTEINTFLDNTPLKKWRDEEWSDIRKARTEKLRIKKHITGFPEKKRSWLEKFFELF